ncbi:choice-of-anchor R domain-containing protein [Paludisphaera rhizosphaerae]|uniref:choice-of-anchor R domain-containing protein n=1 Tax=Paludisphaera rhizosphaerae TaxID=2711216 RepID=UPI0013EDA5BD|nr:choice-of-anchor R domain-containing protein [Paludisphaera rhizosphaerae]
MVSPSRCCGAGALLAFVLLGLSSAAQADIILADNLSQTTGGADAVTGASWLAASFQTDGSAYSLSSLTLDLARTSIGGSVVVDLYTDGDLEPGSLLATYSADSSISTTASPIVFSIYDMILSANTTYWVVLRAVTGEFEWSWASSNLGSGVGFSTTTAMSDDAGSTWFTADSYPYQMSVTAAAVPEPGSIALAALGAVCVVPVLRRARRRA